MYERQGKRALDLILVSPALVASLPVQAVLAALVRLKMGKPVLFRQERPGLGGRPFVMLKFRTMTDERDPTGNLLADEARLTGFGRFLRSTSLDELPELWNVLKGDMSLVGPRPLLTHYLSRYTVDQARRHDVRPGITGWAQINGRNTAEWPAKLAMDTWYVDHVSLRLDLRILLRTVIAVTSRQGISATGHATAPEFDPNAEGEVPVVDSWQR